MNEENTIYAAYGSNLNLEQMAYRCPYATVLGPGELPDYELVFRGGTRGAVATVEPKAGASVPVLIGELTPRDEAALDRYEGFPHLYRKEMLPIRFGDKLAEVMVYVMNYGRPLGEPSEYYMQTLVEGYKSAGFDISILEQTVQASK
jgi:hypothetical protein